MKSAFSIISFCSKLNFRRKTPCRYFATANYELSSFNHMDEDCTNYDVDSDERSYFGNEVEVSKGKKTDEDKMEKIKLILGNRGFKLGSRPKQLETVRILDILFEDSSDPELCLYYFKWSGCLSGSNQSLESICRMAHILVAGNKNHGAVDLISHLVKNYGCKEGSSSILLEVFYDTHNKRKTLETTCGMMINCYIKEGMVTSAVILIDQMRRLNVFPSIWVYKSVIKALLQTNRFDMAWDLLEEMQRQVTMSSIIDGHCKGYMHKAFQLLDMMRSTNVTPDVVTYNSLIHGLVMRGFLQEAKDILDELIRRGFSIDVVTYTNIMHGYSKRGNFEEAFLLWYHMADNCVTPDVVTCSALLSGYCRAKHMDEANALFCRMLDIGLKPDLILYNTLIHGFCSVGNVDEGCNLVKKMIESSIIPNNVTHRALVLGFQKKRVMDPIQSATSKLQEILIAYDLQIDAIGHI
ncbi:hypothetical protein IC582_023387 [Cucumis melo]